MNSLMEPIMPLPFTLGTKIVGMYATGYDGYGGADADLEFSIGRYAGEGIIQNI